MGYAIEILFDSKSEKQIFDLMKILEYKGIDNKLLRLKTTPHIALSVFDKIDIDRTINILENITIPPLRIDMYGLGTFNETNNIIFLLPKVTIDLLTVQYLVHRQVSEYSAPWSYYYPSNWIPHCTIAMDIANDKFENAFQKLNENLKPISTKIRLIKFHPEQILFERTIDDKRNRTQQKHSVSGR